MSNTRLIPWRDITAELYLDFDGCPGIVIEQMLRQAAIEFCGAAPVWVRELDPIYTVEGVATYEVDTPEGAELAQLQALTVNGSDLNGWTFARPNIVTFTDRPSGGVLVGVRASLKPSIDSKGLPAWIVSEYGEAMRHGARARLFTMPMKAWTNPQFALVYQRTFVEAIGNARTAVARSHSTRPLTVTPRRFV